jgi:3-phenylpropionate/cinnamic acid dioxygenase small subunit
MDEDFAARAQVLEDRVAINDLIIRYAEAVDNHDDGALASCFTDDATATFAGVPVPGRGGAAIVAFLSSLPGGSAGTAPPMKTSHLFTNVVINLDGDQAEARSRAAVYSVRGTPEQVRVRGISYQDLVRRTPDGWRIAKRMHSVAWEGGMESVPITAIAPQAEEH